MQLLWKLFPVACSKVQHRQPCTFALFRSKQKFPQTLGEKSAKSPKWKWAPKFNSISSPIFKFLVFFVCSLCFGLKILLHFVQHCFFLRDHSRRFMDSLFCCLHHLNLPVKSTWESMFKFGSFPLLKKEEQYRQKRHPLLHISFFRLQFGRDGVRLQ